MATVDVSSDLLLSPTGLVRLDAEFGVQMARTARGNTDSLSEVLVSGWVEKSPVHDETIRYCEIGNVDQMGRVSAVKVTREPEYFDDPNSEKQAVRLREKVFVKNNVGRVHGWAVLGAKTRTYLRKYGLVTGHEDCYYTTDLLIMRPGPKILDKCNSDYEVACCLLWLALKRGPLGNLITALSRWGKEYPTIHIDDIREASINMNLFSAWLDNPSGEQGEKAVETARKLHESISVLAHNQRTIAEILKLYD